MGEVVGTRKTRFTEPGLPHPPVVFKDVFDWQSLRKTNGERNRTIIAEGIIDGKVVVTTRKMCAQRKTKLVLRIEDEQVPLVADGSDLMTIVAYVEDDYGNIKRLCNDEVTFTVSGEGYLWDEKHLHTVPLKWGRAPNLIRSSTTPGEIFIKAEISSNSLNGVQDATLRVKTIPSPDTLIFQEEPEEIKLQLLGLRPELGLDEELKKGSRTAGSLSSITIMLTRIKYLLFILSLFPLLFSTTLAAEGRPNFVFLLVDDLGWGDFGSYGAEFAETPNIDRLADEGMQFSDAYSACTVCSPSRAAILSGRYPARLRLTDWITGHKRPKAKLSVPDWEMRIQHERILLPEALNEAGYKTAFFGKWHLMPIGQEDFEEHYPTAHGFDLNIGGREWGQPKGRGIYFSPFDMPNLDDGEPGDFLTDKLTDAALDFLDSREECKPFLLYLSYYTLHGPIMGPPDLVEKYQNKATQMEKPSKEWLNPQRAAMVDSLDQSVGRIIAKLEELGIADNTVVILTGDNGGDHEKTTGGLRGKKAYSHEGGVRVPLIIKWPGKAQPGSVSNCPVTGTDFYPTILEMAGLLSRPDEHLDGISIAPLLAGESSTLNRSSIYWHYPHYHHTDPYGAVRNGDWKLIEFFEDGSLELYNLAEDPYEDNNLAAEKPELAGKLLEELRAWRLSVDAQMMTPNPNFVDPNAQSSQSPKQQ